MSEENKSIRHKGTQTYHFLNTIRSAFEDIELDIKQSKEATEQIESVLSEAANSAHVDLVDEQIQEIVRKIQSIERKVYDTSCKIMFLRQNLQLL